MLPFTKRPGRGDDNEVITKDDLVQSPVSEGGNPVSHVKRSLPPPPSSAAMRRPAPSAGEDEMTTLIARSVTGPSLPMPNPLPAAGRPPTMPPPPRSRPVSVRPPPASMRPPPASSQHLMDEDEEDEDGRTVVRGAPKIVRRSKRSVGPQSAPASISPAAVIKATLESARSSRRDQLVPGPPADLLEDSADFDIVAGSPHTPFMGLQPQVPAAPVYDRTMPPAPAPVVAPSARALFEGPPTHRPPPSFAPPPSSNAHAGYSMPPMAPASVSGGYPAQMGYGHVPSASASVPGVAMSASVPAHFMTPQAPHADPPATAVTSAHKVSGRPAASWAVALLACGLFVGVAAVAVMQGNDSVADTTASFVDPSRAPKGAGAQPHAVAPPAAPEQGAGATTTSAVSAPVGDAPAASPEAPPPGLIGASPVAAPPVAEPGAAEPAAVAVAPVVTTPAAPAPLGVAFAPVAVQTPAPAQTSAPAPAAPAAAAPVAKAAAPVASPAPRPASTGGWKTATANPTPTPVPRPRAAPPPDDEPAPKKTAKKSGKASSDTDDETKKALEALQKAQLESSNSW